VKRLLVSLIVALALGCAATASAFPEQPGGEVAQRQTGCTSALNNAILGTGGQQASATALAHTTPAFVVLCVP
jgi:hypothetical protein